MFLFFIISVWERVNECTFIEHWLSAISPVNTCGFSSALASKINASASIPAKTAFVLIITPCITLRDNDQFHIHAFMIIAANHSADDNVIARFQWRGQVELLSSLL